MANEEDLKSLYDEILEYAKSKSLRIVFGNPMIGEGCAVLVLWDEDKGWKSFVDFAKEEDVSNIILGKKIAAVAEEDGKQIDEERVGSINLAWIKDNIVYRFQKDAEWWEQLEGVEEEKTTEADYSELLKKPDEELADEMLTFAKETFGDEFLDTRFYEIKEVFLESKGIESTFSLETDVKLKIRKIERLAAKKFEKMQLERDKKILDTLISKCVGWAKENNLKKVVRTNIDVFLMEQGVNITQSSRDILYNKVNLALKRGDE